MGQMQWQRESSGDLALYLRDSENAPWRRYNCHNRRVRDGNAEMFSPGWTTYNALIKAGWELLPCSDRAK